MMKYFDATPTFVDKIGVFETEASKIACGPLFHLEVTRYKSKILYNLFNFTTLTISKYLNGTYISQVVRL